MAPDPVDKIYGVAKILEKSAVEPFNTLKDDLEGILKDPKKTLAEKKKEFFERWDEYAERKSANDTRPIAIVGEKLRGIIIRFINRHGIRYSSLEVKRLNAKRTSRQLFNPHAYSRLLISPNLSYTSSFCAIPRKAHLKEDNWLKGRNAANKKIAKMIGNNNLYLLFRRINQINGIHMLFDMDEIKELFDIYDIYGGRDPIQLAKAIARWVGKNEIEINNTKIRESDIIRLVRILIRFEKEIAQFVKNNNISTLLKTLRILKIDPVKAIENRLLAAIRSTENLWMRTKLMGDLERLRMGAPHRLSDTELKEHFLGAIRKSKSFYEKLLLSGALAKLSITTPRICLHAVRRLGELRDKRAVPVLINAALQNTNSKKLLQEIIIALGKTKDPRAVSFLVSLIRNNNTWLTAQKLAIAALGRIGDKKAISFLKEVAFNWAGGLNILALATVAQFPEVIADPSFRGRLVKLAKSDDSEMRRTATMILAGMDDERAIPELNRMLSEHITLPNGVSRLLKADPSILKEVSPLLKVLYNRTAEFPGHLMAVKLLAELTALKGSQKLERTILGLMKSAKREPKLRKPILKALVYIMNKREEASFPVLKKLLDRKDKIIQRFTIFILGHIPQEEVADLLIKKLQLGEREDPFVRRETIVALGHLGGSGVKNSAVAKALISKYAGIRTDYIAKLMIIRSLGQIGSEVALPFLQEVLNSKHYGTRRAAIDALAMLGRRGIRKGFIAKRLIAEYESGDKKIRLTIFKSLGLIGSKVALPFLKERYYALKYQASQNNHKLSSLSMRRNPSNGVQPQLQLPLKGMELAGLGEAKVLRKLRKRYQALEAKVRRGDLAARPGREELHRIQSQNKEIKYLSAAIRLIENGNGKIRLASHE